MCLLSSFLEPHARKVATLRPLGEQPSSRSLLVLFPSCFPLVTHSLFGCCNSTHLFRWLASSQRRRHSSLLGSTVSSNVQLSRSLHSRSLTSPLLISHLPRACSAPGRVLYSNKCILPILCPLGTFADLSSQRCSDCDSRFRNSQWCTAGLVLRW